MSNPLPTTTEPGPRFDRLRARHARESAGLSQGQAAKALHVPTETLRRWEIGGALPDGKQVGVMACLYDVPFFWLMRMSPYERTI